MTSAPQLDAFRYTLSHDLLSPLRTLQEMARILEREHSQQLPPDASIFLTHFSQGTNKLADRVEALIQFVRLDAQPLNCHTVDVSRLVSSVLVELRAVHGDKAQVIVGELPDVRADADLVRQLFTALLSNAFKFSRNAREPRIEIGCAMSGAGQPTYFVMDNGAGFDMKYAGKLFGLFQRMHGEAQFEGTGAGLAIARRIVERHGGTIRAEAMKDRGAKLVFTLPAASPGGAAGRLTRSGDEAMMAAHILIIEDNDMSFVLADYLLRQAGYSTSRALDGEAGMQAALQNVADLILCDLDLPVMDGYQLAGALRQASNGGPSRCSPSPATPRGSFGSSGPRGGFEGFIFKPVDARTFSATIAQHVAPGLRAN